MVCVREGANRRSPPLARRSWLLARFFMGKRRHGRRSRPMRRKTRLHTRGYAASIIQGSTSETNERIAAIARVTD
jgi:hypothetical protein